MRLLLQNAVFLVLLLLPETVHAQFVQQQATGAELLGNKSGAATWTDLNGDGWPDLIVLTDREQNDPNAGSRLFCNNGTARNLCASRGSMTPRTAFVDMTKEWAPRLLEQRNERSAVAGDVNNDGLVDFVVNGPKAIRIWLQNSPMPGPPRFGTETGPNQESQAPLAGVGKFNIEGVALIDWNNDGFLDLVADNHDYGVLTFRNNAMGARLGQSFVWRGTVSGLPQPNTSSGGSGDYVAATDFNLDGYVDLLLRKGRGLDLFRNNGDETFAALQTPNFRAANKRKGASVFCDLNNDGHFDLFWGNGWRANRDSTNDPNGIYLRDPASGSFSHVADGLPGLTLDTRTTGTDCVDIDNDGDLDLFIGVGNDDFEQSVHNGRNLLFVNESVAGGAITMRNSDFFDEEDDTQGVGFADYDQDGDLDLYVNRNAQANQLWRNDTNDNNYLLVRIAADVTERCASETGRIYRDDLGATFRLFVEGRDGLDPIVGIREINSGKGHGGQGFYLGHVGLGAQGPDRDYVLRVHFNNMLIPGEKFSAHVSVRPSELGDYQLLHVDQGDIDKDGVLTVNELQDSIRLNVVDLDQDGFENWSDSDADGDGIPDNIETLFDDGDFDACATRVNSDNDRFPDYLDSDSDNDGVSDGDESTADYDDDGTPDYRDPDSDDDGVGDGEDPCPLSPIPIQDPDGDGCDNQEDLDDDNDGIADRDDQVCPESPRGTVDRDGDGCDDGVEDPDDDNDGVLDADDLECPNSPQPSSDHDGDGCADDTEDRDDDNDEVPDGLDSCPLGISPIRDHDGDGCDDPLEDVDDDNDGIPDAIEGDSDSDGDSFPARIDLDSDGDGIWDAEEAGHDGEDADGDGVLDCSFGRNGLCDHLEMEPGSVEVNYDLADSDNDSVPDFLDLDSDNDGLHDAAEGHADTDGDGVADRRDLDSDNDGIPDLIESSPSRVVENSSAMLNCEVRDDGVCDGPESEVHGMVMHAGADSDGDFVPDVRDLDSDNDGIFDVIESGHDEVDDDRNGVVDCLSEFGDNGLCNGLEAGDTDSGALDYNGDHRSTEMDLPANTDGDFTFDFRDLDSDNDGINDVVEGGVNCPDEDSHSGMCDGFDIDQDGIVSTLDDFVGFGDSGYTAPRNSDGDKKPDESPIQDYRDLDSDNDSLSDLIEGGSGGADIDANGVVDLSPDRDRDGIQDSVDGDVLRYGDGLRQLPPDADADQRPDAIETDANGDGISDIQGVGRAHLDRDGDGRIDDDRDSDGDGILDVVDGNVGFGHRAQSTQTDEEDLTPGEIDETDGLGLSGGGCLGGADAGASDGGWGALVAIASLLFWIGCRRRFGWLALVCAIPFGWGPNSVYAQVNINGDYPVERFQLSTTGRGILNVTSAEVTSHLGIEIGFWAGSANDPLVFYRTMESKRERVGSVISRRLGGELVAAVGFWDNFELAVGLPVVLSQDESPGSVNTVASPRSFGTGDVRLMPKFQIFDPASDGVGLAFVAGMTLPTSSSDDFFGDRNVSFAPELAVSVGRGLRANFNLGYRVREKSQVLDLVVDDELFARLGVAWRFVSKAEIDLSFAIATGADDIAGAFNRNYSEAIGGVVVDVAPSFTFFAAGGLGATGGFGTPDWRVLAGMRARYAPDRQGHPARLPTVPDPPTVAQPDPVSDQDQDGIADSVDQCVEQPETVNQFEDEDGCPDELLDRDEDSIADVNDECPTQPEDIDSFEDEDGCPDPDNDGDGVLDQADQCSEVPGVIENRGCPDADRDGDTVADRLDNCPDVPGTVENRGCTEKQLVVITKTRLKILDRVYFRSNRAVIRPRSFGLLKNVAQVIKAHPEIGLIRVEGHTDNRGNDGHNLELSQRRAAAVMRRLVVEGVSADRLKAVGFGEVRPIVENQTKQGRATNRRVEFRIVKAGNKPVTGEESGSGADE